MIPAYLKKSQTIIISISRPVITKRWKYDISGLSKSFKPTESAEKTVQIRPLPPPTLVSKANVPKRQPAMEKSPVSKKRNADHSSVSKAKIPVETKSILIPREISAKDLSKLLNIRFVDLVRAAERSLGLAIDKAHFPLDQDSASLLVMEFNHLPETSDDDIQESSDKPSRVFKRPIPSPEERSSWPFRAPVVTIMGHVDHGKTTLLDSLRKTSVAASEAGGITQHIGAFSVILPSQKRITFLDTPGHAAFTSMRARGAKVTDIVVLVVAAEDGIMPQTIEAINHAKAAEVPIIVAINKCDKPDAKPEVIARQLLNYGIMVEEFGGDTQCIQVSGLTGKGLDDLEEAILSQVEILDLRGDATGMAEIRVVESKISKGKGPVATVLVERGTLKPGSVLVFGDGKTYCRIRSISDENGANLVSAGPSTPCEISGAWSSMPEAGDEGIQVEKESIAKQCIADYEDAFKRKKSLSDMIASGKQQIVAKGTLEMKEKLYESKRSKLQLVKTNKDVYRKYIKDLEVLKRSIEELKLNNSEAKQKNTIKELRVVVKADVHGSVEAITHALQNLSSVISKEKQEARGQSDELELQESAKEDFSLKILHSGVGPITQSDIELLAVTSQTSVSTKSIANAKSVLIGFNVPQPQKDLLEVIRKHKIPLISENIIYKLLDDVKKAATGMLTPDYIYDVAGEAEVLAIFRISNGKEIVAGCRVVEGTLFRSKTGAFDGASVNNASIMYRVLRNGVKVYSGDLRSLKHHKNDVASIHKGMECGLSFGDLYRELQVGDRIQCVKKMQMSIDDH